MREESVVPWRTQKIVFGMWSAQHLVQLTALYPWCVQSRSKCTRLTSLHEREFQTDPVLRQKCTCVM